VLRLTRPADQLLEWLLALEYVSGGTGFAFGRQRQMGQTQFAERLARAGLRCRRCPKFSGGSRPAHRPPGSEESSRPSQTTDVKLHPRSSSRGQLTYPL
jgi:hypothetical protein